MRRQSLIVAVGLLVPHSALIWNGRGHMTVAAIAYQQLSQPVKTKVDTLLRQHTDFAVLKKDIPSEARLIHARLYALICGG
jgi:hypothetical protein